MQNNKLDIDQLKLRSGYIPVGNNINENKELLYSPLIYINNNVTSTTLKTPEQINLLETTPILEIGTYRIDCVLLYTTANNSRQCLINLLVDNISYFLDLFKCPIAESYNNFSTFFNIDFLTKTSHTLEIRYARGNQNTTARIKNSRISMRQVS